MRTSDFDYELPPELIAQEPAAERDACRLLVMDRVTGALEDRVFRDIVEYVRPGDLFVVNETRVLPARLLGNKRGTGGAAEVFLLREAFGYAAEHPEIANGDAAQDAPSPAGAGQHLATAYWEALVKPGKRLRPGSGAIVDFVDAKLADLVKDQH